METELNFHSPEFHQNPQSILEDFRHRAPIFPEHVTATMTERQFTRWHFFNHEDVLTMFRDARFVNELAREEDVITAPLPEAVKDYVSAQHNMMLFRDPPDHTRMRSLVNKSFTPRMIEHLNPQIEHLTSHLLSSWDHDPNTDIISALAFPLPVMVIAELLGVPPADREKIKTWSQIFARTLDMNTSLETFVEANQMVVEFRHYFRDIVRERKLRPREDLMSQLIQVTENGEQLSEEELLDMGILLLIAGHETTRNLIANAIYLLTEYPDQAQHLRDNPSMIPEAIEEVLRFESPVMVSTRLVREDLSYKGHLLKHGDVVAGWIIAANRDPAVFQEPQNFDIHRLGNRHLAFGQGIHYCLGAPLARQEATIAVRQLLEHYASIERLQDTVEWLPSVTFRALAKLPLATY